MLLVCAGVLASEACLHAVCYRSVPVRMYTKVQMVLSDTYLPRGKCRGSAPSRAAGTDKQAQGCAGEELQPEWLSPRVRARVLAFTCKMPL